MAYLENPSKTKVDLSNIIPTNYMMKRIVHSNCNGSSNSNCIMNSYNLMGQTFCIRLNGYGGIFGFQGNTYNNYIICKKNPNQPNNTCSASLHATSVNGNNHITVLNGNVRNGMFSGLTSQHLEPLSINFSSIN